jgi:hypothetical protein
VSNLRVGGYEAQEERIVRQVKRVEVESSDLSNEFAKHIQAWARAKDASPASQPQELVAIVKQLELLRADLSAGVVKIIAAITAVAAAVELLSR